MEGAVVQGGSGAEELHLLDTKPGVPVTLVGGAGDDEVSMAGPNGFRVYEILADGILAPGYPRLLADSTTESLWVYGSDLGTRMRIGPIRRHARVWAGARADRIDATEADGPVSVSGFGGNDRILGGPDEDLLDGGDGNDVLSGGRGFDNMGGRDGADRLDARDGAADFVVCGDGNDSALLDRRDRLQRGHSCERVRVDRSAPRLGRPRFTPTRLIVRSSEAAELTATFRRGRRALATREFPLRAGSNRIVFDGRVESRGGEELALPSGAYRVTLRAADPARNRSGAVTIQLRV